MSSRKVHAFVRGMGQTVVLRPSKADAWTVEHVVKGAQGLVRDVKSIRGDAKRVGGDLRRAVVKYRR